MRKETWTESGLIKFEKEIALFQVFEAVLLARDAERLAGEASAKYVMGWNVRDGHLANVAVRVFAKIRLIGDLGVFVPIGGEDTFAARPLKREAEAADPAE